MLGELATYDTCSRISELNFLFFYYTRGVASIESEEQKTVKYDQVIRKWEKGNKKDKKRGKGNVGCGWTKKKNISLCQPI